MTTPAKLNPVGSWIKKRCGRPVQDWIGLINTSPLTKHMEMGAWLSARHGPGHGHDNALVAHILTSRM